MVDKMNLHGGSKFTRGHRYSVLSDTVLKKAVKRFGLGGTGGSGKVRTTPLAGISHQGELTDYQHRCLDVNQREIHLPTGILKNTQVDAFVCQITSILRRIGVLNPQKNQESQIDMSNPFLFYRYRCF